MEGAAKMSSKKQLETFLALLLVLITIAVGVVFCVGTADAAPVGGTAVTGGVLQPGQSETLTVTLEGGETTVITVWGDGGGDLDCSLLTPGGVELARDVADADACMFSIAPARTRTYHVLVWNSGLASTHNRAVTQ